MPLDTSLPFGLRDTKVTPYTTGAATALGTMVDSPNARTLSFAEAEDYEELRGDDKVVAIHGLGPSVEWEMESGGISIPALVAMNGGSTTTSGVSPNQVTTYKKFATDVWPYFHAEGQSISDNGGDFHVCLMRSRASESFEGELSDGSFWLTNAAGRSLPNLIAGPDEDLLYKFVLNETVTPITTPAP